jgi:gas vesicle protein
MRDEHYQNRYRNGGSDTFFAFLTGIVVGTVAMLMANPDNREKLKETIGNVKKKGQKIVTETTKKIEDGVETVNERAKNLAEDAQDAAKKLEKDLSRSRQTRG